MQEFKLPDLGEGMHEAEVVQWLIKPGDTIKLDQTMVKVETDKAIVEIPSPVAGRVAEIRVQDGEDSVSLPPLPCANSLLSLELTWSR